MVVSLASVATSTFLDTARLTLIASSTLPPGGAKCPSSDSVPMMRREREGCVRGGWWTTDRRRKDQRELPPGLAPSAASEQVHFAQGPPSLTITRDDRPTKWTTLYTSATLIFGELHLPAKMDVKRRRCARVSSAGGMTIGGLEGLDVYRSQGGEERADSCKKGYE